MDHPKSRGGPADPGRDPKPIPPEKPFPDECCGSGCAPCILDVYEDEMDRYREKLARWQARQLS